MGIETLDEISSILNKEIDYNLPSDDEVNTRVFSTLLDSENVVASYKMYWLLGILDEVSEGNTMIDFKRIISRMITYAWYPLLKYKLSFGYSDNLKNPVNYIAQKYDLPSNYNSKELLEFIYNNNDKDLMKMMRELSLYVPYRMIAPFFKLELREVKDKSKNKLIGQLSQNTSYAVYRIIDGNKIVINQGWDHYLKNNYRIIKSWIYYKLIMFLQKRNPNVPAIAFKLEAPMKRDLSKAQKLWKGIILERQVNDIYTGNKFNSENYKNFGVLSIDHFIPWSFVLHDKMWNLVPTFKNINSSKSDNLLDYDKYIDLFCNVQYEAFSYVCSKGKKDELEDYIEILRLENPHEYYQYSSREEFGVKLKQNIAPLFQIAVNQGFSVVDGL